MFSSIQFRRSVVSVLFVTPWTAARQASLSIINSRSLPKLMSIESVMPSNHLTLCRPLLLLPSIFPRIRVFSNEKHQVTKVLELQLQHQSFQWIFRVDFLADWLVWSPGWPRDFQESYLAPWFESINSLALSLLYGPTLASVHDYWKKHSFDYMDVCQQSDVYACNKLYVTHFIVMFTLLWRSGTEPAVSPRRAYSWRTGKGQSEASSGTF